MQLDGNGTNRRVGEFLCPKCDSVVVRRVDTGKISKTCGCGMHDHNTTHGGYGTRLYLVWRGIKNRCKNPNGSRYYTYGARGITVCAEWDGSFSKFKDWAMGNGYAKGLQIDRIDNNGNYEPGNCRFTTLKENNRNKCNTKLSMEKAAIIRKAYKTGDYSQDDLAKIFNVTQSSIWGILANLSWV